jgi:lysophospholipase L1-like esterase
MRALRTIKLLSILSIAVSICLACQWLPGAKSSTQSPQTNETKYPLSPDGKILTQSAQYWLKKVAEFREDNKTQTPGGIVLFGDSITQQFPVKQLFPDLHVINRGIGGDKIGGWKYYGLIDRLDVSVYDLKPKKLFILIGINDILSAKTPPGEMKRGYRNLLAALKKNCPNCDIYVQSVLPVRGRFAAFNPKVLKFNKTIKQLTKRFGFTYVDLHPSFADEKGELKAEFTRDDLHLTPPGYAEWKKILLPLMTN